MHEPVRTPLPGDQSDFHSHFIRTSLLPVIYVFGRKPIDVSNCVMELTDSIRDSPRACSAERVVLRCDVVYSHMGTEIAERLCVTLGRPVYYCEIPLKAEPVGRPVRSVTENQRLGATDQDALLYIGSESLSMTNLLITHGSSEVPIFYLLMQFTRLSRGSKDTRLRPCDTTSEDRVAHHK